MAATFRGYFARDKWHLSLGCTQFKFDANLGEDLLVDEGGNDPGIYSRAHELLRPYQRSHERALVVLDCDWDGAPSEKTAIVDHITSNLVQSGWQREFIKVIAIEPELESWIWQDNPLVAKALRYLSEPPLRALLKGNGFWPDGHAKPPRPKEAVEWVLRQSRQPRSSAIYFELANRVSIKGCIDPSFRELNETFQRWFPPEASG